MHDALRYGFVASIVVAGCVVAGVEIDPSLGGGDQAGEGGDAGDTGQGGSTGGKGGSSGGDTGGKGGTSQGGKGGTNQGGTDQGGTDAGGSAGQGGSTTGGAGAGGTAGSGPPAGGGGTGGAGMAGTAGSGPAGGTGGSAGNASCVGIKSNMPCAQEGLSCPNLPCGLADSGRRTCNCMVNWSCTACNFASGRYATQPDGITICGAGIADQVACGDTSAVCGPQAGGEYCACHMDPADGLIWDCDAPPSPWGCTGSSMALTITGGTTAHDHLPLTPAETVDMVTQVRAATAGTSLTLPMDEGHTHALVLTQAHLDTLRSGGVLTGVVSSTFTGHNHTYSIQCGP